MSKKITRTLSLDIDVAMWLQTQEMNVSGTVNQIFRDLMESEQNKDEDIMSLEYDIEQLEKERSQAARELNKKRAILLRKQEQTEKQREEHFKKVSEEADALRRTILE